MPERGWTVTRGRREIDVTVEWDADTGEILAVKDGDGELVELSPREETELAGELSWWTAEYLACSADEAADLEMERKREDG